MKSRSVLRKEFKTFFRGLNVVNFTSDELLIESTCRGHKNSIPEPELWPNCIESIKLLDALRENIDKPIFINSAFRDEYYNKLIGGGKNSFHKQFKAFDISSIYISADKLFVILDEWRKAGKWKGGLGFYEKQNFIHVDNRGFNTTWAKK